MDTTLLEPRGKYLFLQVPDIVDVTMIKVLAHKVDEISKQSGVNKVLVEVRKRKSASHNSAQLLEIGMYVANIFQDRIHFAVLVDYRPEVHGFFESVAETKGMVLRFFEDEPAALQWLEVEN